MPKLNKKTLLAGAIIIVGLAALFGLTDNPLAMLDRLTDLINAS